MMCEKLSIQIFSWENSQDWQWENAVASAVVNIKAPTIVELRSYRKDACENTLFHFLFPFANCLSCTVLSYSYYFDITLHFVLALTGNAALRLTLLQRKFELSALLFSKKIGRAMTRFCDFIKG